jgi:subfamily B ATP-binding cassette protein MsbA
MTQGDLQPRRSNLLRFLRYVRPHKRALAFATLAGVVKFNLPVAFPWIFGAVLDGALSGKGNALGLGLDGLMAAALALFVAHAAVTYWRTRLSDRLAYRIEADVRADLFDHLQRLPLAFFEERQTGALASRVVTDVSSARTVVGLLGTNVLMELSVLAAVTGVLLATDVRLTLLAYATLPLFVLSQKLCGRRMRRQAAAARARMERVEGRLHESLAGVADVKSFTLEDEESRRFSAGVGEHLEAQYKSVESFSWSLAATALFTRLPAVAALWYGGHLVLRGELSVGALVAFYAWLEMVYSPLQRLGDLNVQLANARAAIDRIFELFDREPEAPRTPLPALRIARGTVRFERLTFGYRPNEPVLRELDLELAPGRRLALVGASGAGKSTLTKLLVRFHEPWSGRVLIDGQDIAGVDLRSLRAAIALVPQEPMLFQGTIADNLRVGRASASPREVEAAAARARVLDFARELPGGLEAMIGERGAGLSGGQKQRIAIARAFLKDAPVLVLDESTSELDPLAEQGVNEALEELARGRTALVIAHRLSTAARCDEIAVLAGGRVVERGSHAELHARDGTYSALYGTDLAQL